MLTVFLCAVLWALAGLGIYVIFGEDEEPPAMYLLFGPMLVVVLGAAKVADAVRVFLWER